MHAHGGKGKGGKEKTETTTLGLSRSRLFFSRRHSGHLPIHNTLFIKCPCVFSKTTAFEDGRQEPPRRRSAAAQFNFGCTRSHSSWSGPDTFFFFQVSKLFSFEGDGSGRVGLDACELATVRSSFALDNASANRLCKNIFNKKIYIFSGITLSFFMAVSYLTRRLTRGLRCSCA